MTGQPRHHGPGILAVTIGMPVRVPAVARLSAGTVASSLELMMQPNRGHVAGRPRPTGPAGPRGAASRGGGHRIHEPALAGKPCPSDVWSWCSGATSGSSAPRQQCPSTGVPFDSRTPGRRREGSTTPLRPRPLIAARDRGRPRHRGAAGEHRSGGPLGPPLLCFGLPLPRGPPQPVAQPVSHLPSACAETVSTPVAGAVASQPPSLRFFQFQVLSRMVLASK